MNSVPCPSLSDLFQEPRSASVESHRQNCLRCQALLRNQGERLPASDEFSETTDISNASEGPREADPEIVPGSIALIDSPETDELLSAVITKAGEEAITVVPLSANVESAGDWDMLLERDVLGYEAMAEIWNYGSVLPEQIVETVAQLAEARWHDLEALLRAIVVGDQRPEAVAVGPMILAGSDPRLTFQDEESERLRAYWEPTLTLAGAATLGQLVAHRREELGLAPEELEEVSLMRGWLDEFERDTLDIQHVLHAPASLAALMKRLRIGASQRLGRIALVTIEAHHGQQGIQTGTALARQRQGYHAKPSDEQSAPDYVAEFLRELEKP